MAFLSWLIETLLQWYVWLPIVLVLAYLTWRNYQQVDAVRSIESTLLIIEVPDSNSQGAAAAEQLFVGLHDILRDSAELRSKKIQEHMSFEIVASQGVIRFYVWVPKTFQSFIEGHIESQYPSAKIYETSEDYIARERQYGVTYTAEMHMKSGDQLPIKTYTSLETDPLAGITSTLAKLGEREEIWIQILARPLNDTWQENSKRWVSSVKNGSPFDFLLGGGGELKWLGDLFGALWQPPQGGPSASRSLSQKDAAKCSAAETKATKKGYKVRIRVVYLGDSQSQAKLRLQAMNSTFKQFTNTGINGFKLGHGSFNKEDLSRYKSRLFIGGGFILNVEELASVFHLPHSGLSAPNIAWLSQETEVTEPVPKLPIITGNQAIDDNISAFGITHANGLTHQFGLLRSDRSRHVYIIGQTGAGKTATLELLALSDIYQQQGYAIIDPHGDFAINNLRFVPASRLQDVVYFNPADTAWPLGFNPLEITNPDQKSTISSELIGVFKRMFGDSWGPRLEYILRYTILALLDRPSATMLDITRMLTDKKFREETLSYCQDAVVLQFWQVEFGRWNEKFQTEAIAPVLNKVGAFTANPVIRNIIGQPKSTFNVREIMDDGKILVVNLSKGLIGEDNAAILGSLLVTKIQLAAMSRSDIPDIQDRKPFYLYVDEFQNFATDSFATILSEARKYGLNLTVANQYTSQMSPTVRDAVFGNVGSVICFRVSGDDASLLSKEFEPQFTSSDLVNQDNRHFVSTMVIDGEKIPAFAASTLELPPPQMDNLGQIIEYTRQHFAASREEVEQHINSQLRYTPLPTARPPLSAPATTPAARPVAAAPLNYPYAGSDRVGAPLTPVIGGYQSALPPQQTPGYQAMPQPSAQQPPRKKRSRSHKKKSGSAAPVAAAPQPYTQQATPPQPQYVPQQPQAATMPLTPAAAPAKVSPLIKDPTKLRIRHAAHHTAKKEAEPPKPAPAPEPAQPKHAAHRKHQDDETVLRIR